MTLNSWVGYDDWLMFEKTKRGVKLRYCIVWCYCFVTFVFYEKVVMYIQLRILYYLTLWRKVDKKRGLTSDWVLEKKCENLNATGFKPTTHGNQVQALWPLSILCIKVFICSSILASQEVDIMRQHNLTSFTIESIYILWHTYKYTVAIKS